MTGSDTPSRTRENDARDSARASSRTRRASRWMGWASAAIGAVALLGWALNAAWLKSVFPGTVSMKPNTAVGLILLGTALSMVSSSGMAASRLPVGLALLATALGAATLAQVITGGDFGIDQLLFREPAGAIGTAVAGRMASETAFCFILLGLALLLVRRDRGIVPAQILAGLVAVLATFELLASLLGARGASNEWPFTLMAFNTSVAIFLIAGGILVARADRGPMMVTTGRTSGSRFLRRIVPVSAAFLLVVDTLDNLAEKRGFFGRDIRSAISLTAAIAFVSFTSWVVARRLHFRELHLGQTELKYRRLHESMTDAFVLVDMSGRILESNPAYRRLLGYTEDELAELTYQDLTPQRWHAMEARIVEEEILARDYSGVYEKEYRLKDGTIIPVELRVSLVRNEEGQPEAMSAIVRDITERKRAEERVRELNRTLEARVEARTHSLAEANRELESFSSSVSHDLRAPLRSIDGFARMLEEDHAEQLDEQGRHYLEVVRSSATSMGHLIDSLLRFSRLGRDSLHLRKVDLATIAREVVREDLQQEIERRSVEVIIGEVPTCTADPEMLRIMLSNLMSNAVKFTEKRERAVVEFGVTRKSGEIAYFVGDNGAGFDMRYSGKLFGVFERLHNADEFEGTGVGLAIAQRIIHRHGGRIWAEAQVGRGATFYFTIGETI